MCFLDVHQIDYENRSDLIPERKQNHWHLNYQLLKLQLSILTPVSRFYAYNPLSSRRMVVTYVQVTSRLLACQQSLIYCHLCSLTLQLLTGLLQGIQYHLMHFAHSLCNLIAVALDSIFIMVSIMWSRPGLLRYNWILNIKLNRPLVLKKKKNPTLTDLSDIMQVLIVDQISNQGPVRVLVHVFMGLGQVSNLDNLRLLKLLIINTTSA